MSLSVSVALCTYNSARFIEEQVESILNQTLLPAEVVVSDDGSTDDTLDRIRAVFAGYSGTPVALRILENDVPLGVTRNFERAVAACVGDLIALCDHDDVWHPNRLSVGVALFEDEPDLLLQHSDARLVDAQGNSLGLSLLAALLVSNEDRAAIAQGRAFEVYLRRNLATGATILFRRSLLRGAIPFPAEWVHDEWLAMIAAASGGVVLVEEQLIDYRQHGSNEIGVEAPTLRNRIARLLQPRGDRYVALAARASSLLGRLREIGADDSYLDLASEKARFESVRARFPRRRVSRIAAVAAEFRRGSYARLSSQRNLDVLRDLIQPG